MTSDDKKYLREALVRARQGRGLASPNPMVGAVAVGSEGLSERKVVGRGSYSYDGVQHAEVSALQQAGERARGGTLYVSLEPCSVEGRTPPCCAAILAAGIRRVVAPIEDEYPGIAGSGFRKLRDAGVEVVIAEDFAAEARKLNEAFFHFSKTAKPLVTLKAALTLDGKIAAPDDNRDWITSEAARAHVQQVRHDHDAILTGIGTVLADDCLLTDRTGLARRRPLLRVVADSLLRLPLESRLIESLDGDLTVVTTSAAPAKRRAALEKRGVPVKVLDAPGGRVDLDGLVRWLGEQEMISLMLEAGSKLNWAALDSGIVDKVLLFYAPKILGGIDSLPLAGGAGRRSRSGAIQLDNVRTFEAGPNEFAVEAYLSS